MLSDFDIGPANQKPHSHHVDRLTDVWIMALLLAGRDDKSKVDQLLNLQGWCRDIIRSLPFRSSPSHLGMLDTSVSHVFERLTAMIIPPCIMLQPWRVPESAW
jgi:hypothetical protein